jgi:DNA-binding Xre family transcriptional regulator
MIKIKIAELAGKHGLKTAYALQKALDMPPTMASRLYKGDFDKIGIGTIEKLCAYFGCQPDAFLEYPFAPVNHTQASNTQTSNDVARATQLSNTELSNDTQASNTQSNKTEHTESDNGNVMSFHDTLVEFERIGKSKSDSSLRRYLKSGKLKGELITGNLWQIKKPDFENFINSNFFKNLK